MLTWRGFGKSTMSEKLKQLAGLLREKAASEEAETMLRCGQTLQAATALNILREKVSNHVR
jgi:hypothetical protein